jgi:hypothetical protein
MEHYEHNRRPILTDEDLISDAKSTLSDHISAEDERRSGTKVLFFVEIGPGSAGCRHITCKDQIKEGSFRIAVDPGMHNYYKNPGRALSQADPKDLDAELTSTIDFYHVRCFEGLADFSQAAYLDRIQAVTRATAGMRGLKAHLSPMAAIS